MLWTDLAFDCIPSDDRLRQAWATVFGIDQDAVSVIDNIAGEDPWADGRIRIVLERFQQPGEFPLRVMVVLRGSDVEALVAKPERELAMIGRLCAELECRALVASDDVNPYEWSLHTPHGATTVVRVDGRQLDDNGIFVLARQPVTVE